MSDNHPTKDAVDADKAKVDADIGRALEFAPTDALLKEIFKRLGEVVIISSTPDMADSRHRYYNVVSHGTDAVKRLGMIAYARQQAERQIGEFLDACERAHGQ